MGKIEARKIQTESKINASDAERSALTKLLRRIIERGDVTGRVTVELGQGGVTDVTLTEVRKAE